ncbi:MAG: ADP-glyceromanno-heptose 6-epimerase [Candidatus Nanoarchaeia archaeon]|jgi:ADP-L-glycero-D-manno-heptose 6-epimerase|nr:ADP-glyceromanno-heptose 6-epimerase [Candidatus Nanoarchaeia archaeon]|tara:strand:- start:2414 stop:3343 length:930 start_codon:yes stop_codon:yes gene_type:complete
MDEHFIVTGGAGFIGSNLALELQERYPESKITIIDDFSTGHFKNLYGFNGEVITADLRDFDWNKLEKPTAIFHQGAQVVTTETNQKLVMEINSNATKRLINHCVKNNIKLIYASSGATYGLTEPPNHVGKGEFPANVYGYSKLACDNAARQTLKENPNAHIVGLRYFNVYGPREAYKMETKMSSMVWQLYLQMKEGNRPRIFKNGQQKRDFVYIKDIIESNIIAMNTPPGIYNVATGNPEDFNKIVEELNKNLGTNLESEYIDNPYKFYQEFTQADTNNFLPNYKPKYNLESGIKEYIEWIKANENTIV